MNSHCRVGNQYLKSCKLTIMVTAKIHKLLHEDFTPEKLVGRLVLQTKYNYSMNIFSNKKLGAVDLSHWQPNH